MEPNFDFDEIARMHLEGRQEIKEILDPLIHKYIEFAKAHLQSHAFIQTQLPIFVAMGPSAKFMVVRYVQSLYRIFHKDNPWTHVSSKLRLRHATIMGWSDSKSLETALRSAVARVCEAIVEGSISNAVESAWGFSTLEEHSLVHLQVSDGYARLDGTLVGMWRSKLCWSVDKMADDIRVRAMRPSEASSGEPVRVILASENQDELAWLPARLLGTHALYATSVSKVELLGFLCDPPLGGLSLGMYESSLRRISEIEIESLETHSIEAAMRAKKAASMSVPMKIYVRCTGWSSPHGWEVEVATATGVCISSWLVNRQHQNINVINSEMDNLDVSKKGVKELWQSVTSAIDAASGAVIEMVSYAVELLIEGFESASLDGRIVAALRWLGECDRGIVARRWIPAVAAGAVALEAVLGSSSSGIGRELAQRASCVLCRREDRHEVVKSIRRLYDVRSRIVHGSEMDVCVAEHACMQMRRLVGAVLWWVCERQIQRRRLGFDGQGSQEFLVEVDKSFTEGVELDGVPYWRGFSLD